MRNLAMKSLALAGMAVIALGTVPAFADACSGHSHDTGTALGAVGGAAIGGMASHSVGGAIVGGVAGGFAGNAIARSGDCNHRSHYRRHHERRSHYDRHHDRYDHR